MSGKQGILALAVLAAAGSAAMGQTYTGITDGTSVVATGGGATGGSAESVGSSVNIRRILNSTYGGTWVLDANGLDFVQMLAGGGTGLRALRAADSIGGGAGGTLDVLNSNLTSGGSIIAAGSRTGFSDQVWRDGVAASTLEARFAGFTQNIFTQNIASGAYSYFANLAQSQTTGMADPNAGQWTTATSFQDSPTLFSSPFRWVRANGVVDNPPAGGSTTDTPAGLAHTSDNAAGDGNTNLDNLITYQIVRDLTGRGIGNAQRTWFLFWEDGSDNDYNDAAYTINVVPLPPAAFAGLGMLGATVGAMALRRRRLARA